MERETIKKLIKSGNLGDFLIGLQYVRDYRFKDIKDIFSEGRKLDNTTWQYSTSLNLGEYKGYYRLHSALYMSIQYYPYYKVGTSVLTFTSTNSMGEHLKQFII